ncbi:hypothetical protein EP7_005426 [Isosphaeraceae bacterium EP7]
MLKPLTLGVSLALALGMSSVSTAGLFEHGCSTCGIASAQGPIPTAQSVIASPQGCETGGCGAKLPSLGLKTKLCGLLKHKPKTYTYEYVLKKKRVWGHKDKGCDTGCGTVAPVTYATGQGTYAAPQAAPAYGAPQAAPAYGAAQSSYAPGAIAPATLAGDVPPPPEVTNGGSISLTPAGN